jgi:hypothetical protein
VLLRDTSRLFSNPEPLIHSWPRPPRPPRSFTSTPFVYVSQADVLCYTYTTLDASASATTRILGRGYRYVLPDLAPPPPLIISTSQMRPPCAAASLCLASPRNRQHTQASFSPPNAPMMQQAVTTCSLIPRISCWASSGMGGGGWWTLRTGG